MSFMSLGNSRTDGLAPNKIPSQDQQFSKPPQKSESALWVDHQTVWHDCAIRAHYEDSDAASHCSAKLALTLSDTPDVQFCTRKVNQFVRSRISWFVEIKKEWHHWKLCTQAWEFVAKRTKLPIGHIILTQGSFQHKARGLNNAHEQVGALKKQKPSEHWIWLQDRIDRTIREHYLSVRDQNRRELCGTSLQSKPKPLSIWKKK